MAAFPRRFATPRPAKYAFHAIVSGRVQGVGFRWSARAQALRLDLSGWVRNLPDGDVEVHAEGTREILDQFLAWLEKGPPYAHVERVDARAVDPCGYVSFDIED